jgi:type IV pilus assembly protein PilM
MAKRSTPLVGLEIDPAGVHAASVSVNGHLTVQHSASVALEPGVVRDGEVADVDALADALRGLFGEHKELDKRVRIGVANQKIVVRIIELPPIPNAKELEQAVHFQAQSEIPMPLEQAVLDFQPLDLVETDGGTRQRVVLVAARRDMVEKVLAAVRMAGLRPEGLDLSAFAMVRALQRAGAPAQGATLFLSVAGLTNLAVAQGTTCVFTRVVGGGLESLAVELAERRELTLEHARGWLEHVGLEAPVEALDGDPDLLQDARSILLDGVRRIATDVRNSVDYQQSQAGGPMQVDRCVLTGPAAALAGFAPALSAEMRLPVETGAVDAPDDRGLHVAVAAGLAIEDALS